MRLDRRKVYSTNFLGIHRDQELTWNFCEYIDSPKLPSSKLFLRQLSKYCVTHRVTHYRVLYPHVSDGLPLWEKYANMHLARMFILKKRSLNNFKNAIKTVVHTGIQKFKFAETTS